MMKNYWKSIYNGIGALVMMTVSIAGPTFAADAGKFAVGVGMEYATGDYNTAITTDSLRLPLTIDYFPTKRVSLELVIPFLYQNNSNTILAGGMRFPFERQRGLQRTSFNTSDSVSGFGDISFTTRYLLQKESNTLPGLRPLLYLKLPTADDDKALGTGEFDIGGGIGIFKWFGPWFTFAEGRYIFQGSNADLGLKDFATLEGEIGYQLTGKLFPSLSLWWSSAPADDSSELMEAKFKGTYWIDEDVHLEGYLGKGLTSTSADFGAGLAIFLSF
jgi:hypothetical protein